jgi:hypothetical protein
LKSCGSGPNDFVSAANAARQYAKNRLTTVIANSSLRIASSPALERSLEVFGK